MANGYVHITEETAKSALERVYKDLQAITDGRADEAIEWAKEYIELSEIVEQLKKPYKTL